MIREIYKTDPIKTNPQKQPRMMSTGSVLPGAGVDEGAESIQPSKKSIGSIENIPLGSKICKKHRLVKGKEDSQNL